MRGLPTTKCSERLRRDDIVNIKSIDRLGRNYNEVIEQWQYLTRVKGVDIVVIKKLPDNFPPDL